VSEREYVCERENYESEKKDRRRKRITNNISWQQTTCIDSNEAVSHTGSNKCNNNISTRQQVVPYDC
jgi:hypothetical protein